jgi:arsenate reductase
MPIKVYGIPNCDTVKRARAWLLDQGIMYSFHDYKKAGVPIDRIDVWLKTLGWETLVNRQGTTWRKLDEAVRQSTTDTKAARQLMLAQPSVIKRPLVEWAEGHITVGFQEREWASHRS